MARILSVEDYQDLRDFFSELLQVHQFEVRSAASGAEAEKELISFTPDLILLDVMLHGEDGREICKHIKASHKGIYIILISANPKLLADYEDCEADDVIEKPFSINDVLLKIKSLITKKNNPV